MAQSERLGKPWYRKKQWWVAGVVALALIASAIAGHHTKPVSTGGPGSASNSSLGATGSSTTSTTEDDLGGPGAPTVAGSVVPPGAESAAGQSACRSGYPLANVYHPNRLAVLSPCMTVSGTVATVTREQDGDTHFDLALDPQYTGLLKPANYSGQHGRLVVEIVPADASGCTPGQPPRPATGSYNYGICTGADEATPVVGAHVYVTGPYVADEDHGGWAEIHPVWAISTTSPTSGSTSPPPTQAESPTSGTSSPAPTAAPPVTANYRAWLLYRVRQQSRAW